VAHLREGELKWTTSIARSAATVSQAEIDLMNEIKAIGPKLNELVEKLRATEGLDQRWVAIGKTDLQTGLMALTRAVAQPTFF
jgi:hypothetical protein